MLVLEGDEDFISAKKVIPLLEPRAAAPVAMTSLGLGICTCPRPKEVVDWYTNGGPWHPGAIGVPVHNLLRPWTGVTARP